MSMEAVEALRACTTSTPVTPSDSVAQPTMRRLYVGGAGVIVGRLANDTADRSFTAPAGAVIEGRFILIKATGTTATLMLALN